ncbi:MAG: GyrI-like domain-containing protein [Syntrophomonadaceae bacterium]|jgi:effector-binding domain-containing protein|nr:GyrI-like domain-containing protein [Syntrophomonadaceae bacterium]
MTYTFDFSKQEAQNTISIRTRTAVQDLPQVLGQAFPALMNYLNEMGVQATGAPFVGYFNMDMQDLDIEVGFPVAEALVEKGEIKPGIIPAGKQLSCLYQGPYNQIEPAYNAIMDYAAANNYALTGVCYEFYLNDPADTPENELLTKIVMLAK